MCRESLTFLVAVLVIPFPALAENDECVAQKIADGVGIASEEVIAEALHQPVFLALGSYPEAGEKVTLEVRVDGAPYFTEELELIGADLPDSEASFTSTPVVELLAANEPRLGHLYRLAQSHRVEVTPHLDGTAVGSDSFSNLATKSQKLLTGSVRPYAVRSTVNEPAKLRRKDACHDYCDDRQDECYERCGQFGSASCYNSCDNQWVDCLENCGSCQPSTTTNTTYTTVGYTPLGVECRYSAAFGLGHYLALSQQIKVTVTTTTTNADCSQTVTTDVSYIYQICFGFVETAPCSPVGTANLCVS